MELGPEWVAAGPWGLFLASFLAATVLPFSSELVLATMATGPWSFYLLWACASLGNWLGGMTNYGLGRWIASGGTIKWLQDPRAKARSWRRTVDRWGHWAALATWLPVVGDAIAVALGLFRSPWPLVALWMFVGKALRYAILLWMLVQIQT